MSADPRFIIRYPSPGARCECCDDRIDPHNWATGSWGGYMCLPCHDDGRADMPVTGCYEGPIPELWER